MDLEQFRLKSKQQSRDNQAFYKKLAQRPPGHLDELFHEAHDEVFAHTDCLECANCCKTTSPIFYNRDIDRAAKAVGLRPGDFMDKYLRIDEDKDYVLKSSPCPFLGPDNYCSIYDDRPTACREYPHTDRRKMHQILPLTYQNTLVCPAVLEITEMIRLGLNNRWPPKRKIDYLCASIFRHHEYYKERPQYP